MGCISTKKSSDKNFGFENEENENIYRVQVIRLLNNTSSNKNGFLELTPKDLIFSCHGKRPIVWSLQHLRRYGMNGDVFSFEAGRRCMTGPGIYVFRCERADRFYQLFQSQVNAVTNFCGESHQSTIQHNECIQNTNMYLEPLSESDRISSHSSLPFTNVSYTNDLQRQMWFKNNNIYQEFPIKPSESNKSQRTYSNLSGKNLNICQSKDSRNSKNLHMYENIFRKSYLLDEKLTNPYINNESQKYKDTEDINIRSKKNEIQQKGINYIVLDLDNTKQTVSSPKIVDNTDISPSWNNCDAVNENDCPCNVSTLPKKMESHDKSIKNSTLGYSTIDFIKTYALIKSSTNASEFEKENGLRITRHSTCEKLVPSVIE